MARQHLPSVEALIASDDERLTTELRLSEARDQVAQAKDLLDAVDLTWLSAHLVGPLGPDGASNDALSTPCGVAAELARVGCRIVELASALSRSQGAVPRSRPRERAHAVP